MAKAAKAITDKPSTQKHAGGRPLIFKTKKQLQDAIDEYFAYCDNRTRSVYIKEMGDNLEMSDPAPYTMSGLAYALGVDRKTILNYGNKDEFFLTVKRARERVEAHLDERVNDKNTFTPGIIFNLKNNFGWVDAQQQDLHVKEMPTPILGGLTAPEDGDAV